MELDSQSYRCQFRIIVASERVEVVGTHLRASISAPQIVLEEDCHLLHHSIASLIGSRSHLQGGDQVFLAIGAHLTDRKLRSSDNHRLTQILQHKTQCRSRKRHRVGAMKHHKSIILIVVAFNGLCNISPVRRIHVAAIDWRIKLNVVDVVVEQLHFRHIFHQMREIEWEQSACHRILYHADSATSVDDENFRAIIFHAQKFLRIWQNDNYFRKDIQKIEISNKENPYF